MGVGLLLFDGPSSPPPRWTVVLSSPWRKWRTAASSFVYSQPRRTAAPTAVGSQTKARRRQRPLLLFLEPSPHSSSQFPRRPSHLVIVLLLPPPLRCLSTSTIFQCMMIPPSSQGSASSATAAHAGVPARLGSPSGPATSAGTLPLCRPWQRGKPPGAPSAAPQPGPTPWPGRHPPGPHQRASSPPPLAHSQGGQSSIVSAQAPPFASLGNRCMSSAALRPIGAASTKTAQRKTKKK